MKVYIVIHEHGGCFEKVYASRILAEQHIENADGDDKPFLFIQETTVYGA